MIISQVFEETQYHIVIFGTCGIVPAELEEMYPTPITSTCWESAGIRKILDDFLHIETDRVAGYLEKTRHTYQTVSTYCIGLFREALIRGSEQSGVPIDLILPTRDMINRVVEEGDCIFEEGSLSMDEYPGEFTCGLIRFRNAHYGQDRDR